MLSATQTQLVLGSLLGDMTATFYPSGTARLQSRHGYDQHEYNCLKYQTLSAFVGTPPAKRKNDGYGTWSSVWGTLCRKEFAFLQTLCFRPTPDGRLRKTPNPEWLARIGPTGLAWWLGDDGSFQRRSRTVRFHTEGFTPTESELLAAWLAETWQVPCRTRPLRGYTFIETHPEGYARLQEVVGPYLPACMAYKLPREARLPTRACAYCGTPTTPRGGTPAWALTPTAGTRRVVCTDETCRRANRRDTGRKYLTPDRLASMSARGRTAYHENLEASRKANRDKQAARLAAMTPQQKAEHLAKRRARRASKKTTSSGSKTSGTGTSGT